MNFKIGQTIGDNQLIIDVNRNHLLCEQTLTDGSKVYNIIILSDVILNDGSKATEGSVEIGFIDKYSAINFASIIEGPQISFVRSL